MSRSAWYVPVAVYRGSMDKRQYRRARRRAAHRWSSYKAMLAIAASAETAAEAMDIFTRELSRIGKIPALRGLGLSEPPPLVFDPSGPDSSTLLRNENPRHGN